MTRALLLSSVFLFASLASAEEVYLPLARETRVAVVNRSADAVNVTVEACAAAPLRKALPAGETFAWRNGSDACGAARITSDGPVHVDAASHCAKCNATAAIPVLDREQASDDGVVSMQTDGKTWRSGVGFINPENAPVTVSVSVYRGEEVIEQKSIDIAAHTTHAFLAADGDSIRYSALHPVLAFGYARNDESGATLFTRQAPATLRRRRAVRSGGIPAPAPQTVTFFPSKDNTLFENSAGIRSNGIGRHIFAGTIISGDVRRAALAFNIGSQVPPGSTIRSVSLTLLITRALIAGQPLELRAISKDWGEGESNAGSSRDGAGVASKAGDATWIHTFYPDQRWTTPGGDFAATPDATSTQENENGEFTFPSSAGLVARVQSWLDQPATNFGWMLLGDETRDTTARRFESRQAQGTTPALTVEFTPPR